MFPPASSVENSTAWCWVTGGLVVWGPGLGPTPIRIPMPFSNKGTPKYPNHQQPKAPIYHDSCNTWTILTKIPLLSGEDFRKSLSFRGTSKWPGIFVSWDAWTFWKSHRETLTLCGCWTFQRGGRFPTCDSEKSLNCQVSDTRHSLSVRSISRQWSLTSENPSSYQSVCVVVLNPHIVAHLLVIYQMVIRCSFAYR